MTRKCAYAGFSFVAAAMLASAFRGSFNTVFLLSAFAVAAAAFGFLKDYRKQALTCFLFFSLGMLSFELYTRLTYEPLIALDGKTVTFEGYVEDFTQISPDYDAVTVKGRAGGAVTRIRFTLPSDSFDYYEGITVTGPVERIRDSVSFQAEKYYYSKGVFLEGAQDCSAVRSGKIKHPLMRLVRLYRDRLFSIINEELPGREGAFLSAMLCGDKSEMTPAMKTAMYRCGLGHIFAVSGTHLVLLSVLLSAILSRLLPVRKVAFCVYLAVIWSFALFSGLSVSVVRAAFMLTLSRSGFFFGRKSDGLNSLGLCAMLLTAAEPYSSVSPSFVLSFSAVLALCFDEGQKKENTPSLSGFFKESTLTSMRVLFFTAPASALLFRGVSAAAVLSNILLVPMCVFSLMLCFIILITGGFIYIAGPVLLISSLPVKLTLFCTDFISTLPFCYVSTSGLPLLLTVISTSFLAAFVSISARRRTFALIGVSVMFLWSVCADISRLVSEPTVTAIPAGKGTEYILNIRGRAYIFDVNCRGRRDSAVQRFIENRGVYSVELAFISRKGTMVAADYPERFCFMPERVFVTDEVLTESDPELEERYAVICQGQTADNGLLKVTCTDDGFLISCGEDIFLGPGYMTAGEKVYDLTEMQYPVEMFTQEQVLRRLDYAFDQSYTSD
ncbi:MAG: ComEC/Rec2 family competence protein [Ruminococcus sp.]|nr:ComEC/Rec2 family competence protein [Ruminococcus sp.]